MNNLLKGNGKKQLSKLESIEIIYTAQKLKLSIKDLFSKFDQIRSKLRFGHIYWKTPENFIFCAAVGHWHEIF